jgi:hypothetical protein
MYIFQKTHQVSAGGISNKTVIVLSASSLDNHPPRQICRSFDEHVVDVQQGGCHD